MECQCDCGRIATPLRWNLSTGDTTSCGCQYLTRRRVEVDQEFGELTVTGPSPVPYHVECACSCGQAATVKIYHLLTGHARSCGHLRGASTPHEPVTPRQWEVKPGEVFGDLVIRAEVTGPGPRRQVKCECTCGGDDCRGTATVRLDNLIAGLTTSCGSLPPALEAAELEALAAAPPEGPHVAALESLRWDGLITARQLAAAFRVTVKTVTDAVQRKELTRRGMQGKQMLFDPARVAVRADGRRGPVDASSELARQRSPEAPAPRPAR